MRPRQREITRRAHACSRRYTPGAGVAAAVNMWLWEWHDMVVGVWHIRDVVHVVGVEGVTYGEVMGMG